MWGSAVVDEIDREYFLSKVPGRTYYSKTFGTGELLRYHSRVFDNEDAQVFARVKDELVLRVTNAGRIEIRATVLEDERNIRTLLIQKFSRITGPHEHAYFTFRGNEIGRLIDFLDSIRTVPLEGDTKLRLTDEQLRNISLSQAQARSIINKNPDVFVELARSENLQRDLVAIGYRRKQLEAFEQMLGDHTLDEKDWQAFFEANTWIFGYGLSYQFLSGLSDKKLEQTVRGYDLSGGGKRVDALMKTRGRISSLCFVEIKKPTTDLCTNNPYRSDVWSPSAELAGGVAQVQTTVHATLERLGRKLTPHDEQGDPTGEVLFNIEPRSCLVIGSLGEFHRLHGINEAQFRSFELYRRNTWRPEIVTFDELLERARFIVEHSDEIDDDIPF
jgi:hypothetical protein